MIDPISIKFAVGHVVRHAMFDYRGVIVGVDLQFRQSDEWYEQVARSRPPRDKPWYRVLVHGSGQVTYVAERNLSLDASGEPVNHPMLADYFTEFQDGCYADTRTLN